MAQHQHLIAAALIRNDDQLLLVQQQGRHDVAPTWALPGGVVEAGELITEALAREVGEETGLVVELIKSVAYIVQVDHPGEDYQALTFVFEVRSWSGTLAPADPDNVILNVAFHALPDALANLESLPPRVMREPLVAYLRDDVAPGTLWLYRQHGDDDEQLATVIGAG